MTRQLDCAIERDNGVTVIKPSGRLDSGQIGRFEQLMMGRINNGETGMWCSTSAR